MVKNNFIEQYKSIEKSIKDQGQNGAASMAGKWDLDGKIGILEKLISEDLGKDVKLKFLQDKNQRINSNRNSRIVRNTIGTLVGAGITYGLAEFGTDSIAVLSVGAGTLAFGGNVLRDVSRTAREYVHLFKLNDEKILKNYK